jgi:hypothetical protein
MSRTKKLKAPDFDASVVTGTFTEAQWQAIRASLAAVGVDLDATKALRDALQEMAWYYSARSRLEWPLTPKQQAAELEKYLAALKGALDVSVAGYHVDAAHADATRTVLTDSIAGWQRRLDELMAMGSRSNESARKLHTEYWIELTRLWQEFTAGASRRRPKNLSQFLFACSAPLFPEATKREKAISAFVDRNFPQTST